MQGDLICVPLEKESLDELDIEMMTNDNTARHETAFTVSVDYLIGTTTGISAFDRHKTIKALIDKDTIPKTRKARSYFSFESGRRRCAEKSRTYGSRC